MILGDGSLSWRTWRLQGLEQLVTSQSQWRSQSNGYLCMIVFGLHSPSHSVEGQAPETVPLIFTGGLPTSTQLKKIPPRHADRPTWPRQVLTEAVFPGDSRLCQADKTSHLNGYLRSVILQFICTSNSQGTGSPLCSLNNHTMTHLPMVP